MAEKSRKPRLRFRGFTETWEQRELGDIFKYEQPQPYIVESTEYQDSYSIPVLTAGQSFILGYTNEESGIKNASSVNPVVIFDDFTTSSHYVDFPFKVKSSAMKLLSLADKSDNIIFCFTALQKIDYVPVSHERHWISTFSKFEVLCPSKAEQNFLGNIFRKIDNLITLHQRKYNKFVAIKKALLEKMFPRDGKSVPEIRFKGFTETWGQRKVQDVADRYDNLRIPVAANLRVSGNIPYYGANGIQDYVDGFTHEGEFVLVAEDGANDLKNYPVQHVQGRIWVNNHAHVLQGKPALMNNLFLAYSLHRADIASFLVGGSRAKLNADTLMALELLLPSVEEQTKIERNLAAVDNLITLHQQQLERLKNIKSALLEKMFV